MTGGHWQPDALLRECKRAIEEHLAGRVQQGLERARKVGRGAAQAGRGLTELAAAYRNAIAAAGMSSGSVAPLVASALDCLCVSFRPFEELARSATEALSQIQRSRDGFSLIKAELFHQNQQLAAAREAEEREKARYHAL